jgi:competence protein ComGF
MTMTGENDNDRKRRQKIKNWALLAALLAFVVVVYFVSIIRMGGH